MAKSDSGKRSWFARHKVLTGLLIFVGLIVVISAASGGGDTASRNASQGGAAEGAQSDAKTGAATAKVGEKVRDGKFEFVVNSIKCGETSVGQSEYLQEKAQGQFCRLNLAITNIGNEAQSMFADNQKLKDAQNREYSYASTATIYAAPSGSTNWYNEINPGNTVSGDIVFDVPAGVTPVTAELHDSAFSNGVSVTLQ